MELPDEVIDHVTCGCAPLALGMASTLSSDLQTVTSGLERDGEPGLDVEVLRESARKGLINALNSVRRPASSGTFDP